MKIKKNSDITLVSKGIIAHGVNRQVTMGSGVAKALYDRWYIVKEQYLTKNDPVPELGSIDPVIINDKLAVINCYTQETYGYDGKMYANIHAVHLSLIFCAEYAIMGDHKKIHIPLIGCDRGGLKWNDVKKVVQEIEQYYKEVTFIVHML